MTEWTATTAEWYAAAYGEYATHRLGVDAFDVASDAVVVDVGCGTGSALRRIATRVVHGRLIGVDPTPRMISIARERASHDPNGARIEFVVAPAESIPLEDASADVVLAFDSIDHWRDTVTGLGEVHRVLKPNGRLVVVKDGAVPGASKAVRSVDALLAGAGFVVRDRRRLTEGSVTCTVWICGRA